MGNVNLFGETCKQIVRMDVLPVSVVDVNRQSQPRRRDGSHAATSSRSDYSHFPLEVGDLVFGLFLRECRQVFDPFAGWGERHALARPTTSLTLVLISTLMRSRPRVMSMASRIRWLIRSLRLFRSSMVW